MVHWHTLNYHSEPSCDIVQNLQRGNYPGASGPCTYKKQKESDIGVLHKKTAGYYIMKRHIWLIGGVLPPCGQIPVTKWQNGQCS